MTSKNIDITSAQFGELVGTLIESCKFAGGDLDVVVQLRAVADGLKLGDFKIYDPLDAELGRGPRVSVDRLGDALDKHEAERDQVQDDAV